MTDCPICTRGQPLSVIREFKTTWVTAPRRAPLPDYLCVVAKRHVDEPYELPPDESRDFWATTMAVAQALAEAVHPRKMNYEIHGNTISHLHMHLFPRFNGDPFEGRPIDGRENGFDRSADELDALANALTDL